MFVGSASNVGQLKMIYLSLCGVQCVNIQRLEKVTHKQADVIFPAYNDRFGCQNILLFVLQLLKTCEMFWLPTYDLFLITL